MDCRNLSFVSFAIIDIIEIIVIILLINALLVTLKLKDSAQHKDAGTNQVQWRAEGLLQLDPAKPFHCSHHLHLVLILPPGIDHGGFMVTPNSVGMLGFCSSAQCLHKLTQDPSRLTMTSCRRWKHTTILRMVIIIIIAIIYITYIVAIIAITAIIAIDVIMQDSWNQLAIEL
jgi:hypothetical protein